MKRVFITSASVVVVGLLAAVWFVPGMSLAGSLGLLPNGDFPEIEQQNLTDTQRRIVSIVKQEHATQPSYLKYSEDTKEPWCADFVSWAMKEAGVPYRNPHSGHWRIPGTTTLREYYRSEGRFKSIDSGYAPKVGDIVLYNGVGWFGQHKYCAGVSKWHADDGRWQRGWQNPCPNTECYR